MKMKAGYVGKKNLENVPVFDSLSVFHFCIPGIMCSFFPWFSGQ